MRVRNGTLSRFAGRPSTIEPVVGAVGEGVPHRLAFEDELLFYVPLDGEIA